ncbi:MAG: pyruvate formate-lyase-activating protein [Bacilli bacterium]|nr:pyruvate formate-lyase-activating protein [Bacilli bacterium]
MKGYIHSIETLGLVDGPGIRVVIFMQGCDKRCKFCHNPDTWKCNVGNTMTPKEVLDFVLKYKNYFDNNGGVTFSGGEPLLQKEFLLETLKLLKDNGIHTCIDTAGVIGSDEILDYVDLVLFDIKALEANKYKDLVGTNIKENIDFLDLCQKKNNKLWIRQVIIPTINDNISYIKQLGDFIKKLNNVEKVELLPYHTKAIPKYKRLGINYPLDGIEDMDINECQKLNNLLLDYINDKNT